MVHLATLLFFKGRYVGLEGVLRTWLPFCMLLTLLAIGLGVGLG